MVVILLAVTGSRPLHPGAINVTREQYEAALAKWTSLHVTEYEATIQQRLFGSTSGRWKSIVRVEGTGADAVETLMHVESLQGFGVGGTEPASERWGLVRDTMVLRQFQLIDHLLQQPYESFIGSHGTPMAWMVEFDPTMGYPRSVMLLGSFTDLPLELRIDDVKILKRAGT